MKRHILMASIATLALAGAAPALAGPGGGHGGGAGVSVGAGAGARGGISTTGSTMRDMGRINSQGSVNADARAIERANTNSALGATAGTNTQANTNARVNSQGPANASVNGLAHASSKSVLSAAGRTDLAGLASGTALVNASGTTVGTVNGLVTNRDGALVGVQVSLAGGGTATIPVSTISVDGSTYVTTWMKK